MVIDYFGDGIGSIKRTTQVLWNALTGWYVTNVFVLLSIVSIVEPDFPFKALLKLFRAAKDSGVLPLLISESAIFCPLCPT
jgi:hypothetical protein